MRTSPSTFGQIPTITLANVDLPDPEGPSTTTTVPGETVNDTFLRMGVLRPSALA